MSQSESKKAAWALARGQVISLLTAGTGICASRLSAEKPSANFPVLLAFLNYLLCSTYLVRPALRTMFWGGGTSTDSTSNYDYKSESVDGPHYQASSSDVPTHRLATAGNDNSIEMSTSEQAAQAVTVSRWWYLLAAFCDLEANYLIISAFNHTSYTSIAILDCFTIPSAMALSSMFLRCRYKKMHYIGTLICLLGLGCVVLSDFVAGNTDDDTESSNSEEEPSFSPTQRIGGDMLALGGAFLYACSNVLQETLLKFDISNGWVTFDTTHAVERRDVYIGYIGMYGMLIAFIQCAILEGSDLLEALPSFSSTTYLYYAGFVASLFFFYTNTSTFLQSDGDATLFNLSLLTSDIYAVLFTYFDTGHLVHWLYFLAFAFVGTGVYVYYQEDSPSHEFHLHQLKLTQKEENNNKQHEVKYDKSLNIDVDGHVSNHSASLRELQGEIDHIESAFAYNPLGGSDTSDEDFDIK